MTEKEMNTQAFADEYQRGLSKLEYFTAMAMQAMITSQNITFDMPEKAVAYAKQTLKALEFTDPHSEDDL